MRSSGRIRKSIVRFGDENDNLEDIVDSPHNNNNNNDNNDNNNGRRKSSRTHKRPRTFEDDYYNESQTLLESQQALVVTKMPNKSSKQSKLGQKKPPPPKSSSSSSVRSIPKKKMCTTKNGLKYVVKAKTEPKHEFDLTDVAIPIQTVTAPTILKASKKQYRPSKTEQSSTLFQIPSHTHRSKIYLQAAKAISKQESIALPSHGGRLWECIVTIQDPQGAYATSEGTSEVKSKTQSNNKAKSQKSSPLFLWSKSKSNTWRLELAALPNIINQIDVIDIKHGLLKSVQEDDHEEKDLDSSQDEEYVISPISLLSTVAQQDTNYSLPSVDRKWISPDMLTFKTRTSAIQHSLELMERDKLIDKVLHGIGNRGDLLKPKKVTKSQALEAGYWRFLRDGLWVIGQEDEWVEERIAQMREDAAATQELTLKVQPPPCKEEDDQGPKDLQTNSNVAQEETSSKHETGPETGPEIGPIVEDSNSLEMEKANSSNIKSPQDKVVPKCNDTDSDLNLKSMSPKKDMVETLKDINATCTDVSDEEHTNVNSNSEGTRVTPSTPSFISNTASCSIKNETNVRDTVKPSLVQDLMVISSSTPQTSPTIATSTVAATNTTTSDHPVNGNISEVDTNVASSFTEVVKGTKRKISEKIPCFSPSTHFRLTRKQITLCYNTIIHHYERVMYTVKAKALFSELADGFDVFRERGMGRYDMTIKEFDLPEFSFLYDLEKAAWMPVVKKILGEDAVLVHKGAFLSMPGSSTQVYHQDGVHLNTRYQKPCHAINVFIPLVDLTLKNGPTEFCIGSHYLGHEHFRKDMLHTPTPSAGCPLIFDYRLGHRGLGNSSSEPRPIVYLTYTRASKEFRDSVNFSSKSYHKLGEPIEKPLSRKERALKRM